LAGLNAGPLKGRIVVVKFRSPMAIGATSLLATAVIRQWMATLDYRADFGDPTVDPVHPDCRGTKIYVFWHENILLPLHLRGHCRIAMLLSRHDDANILDRVARMNGFGVVRGSTFNGGSVALRQLAERAREENLTITPDGPRGPRRRLAAGCVFLASTLGIPIVAMGLGYERPWRFGTWDRFAVPRPWQRARGVVSRAVFVPSGLDREGIEVHRQGIEKLLEHLSVDAEQWARTGERRPGERRLRKQPARSTRSMRTAPSTGSVCLEDELRRLGLEPETEDLPAPAADQERPAA